MKDELEEILKKVMEAGGPRKFGWQNGDRHEEYAIEQALSAINQLINRKIVSELERLKSHHLYEMDAPTAREYSNLLYDYIEDRIKELEENK